MTDLLPGPILLAPTLRGGQAFRWRPTGKGFDAVVQGRYVAVEQGARGRVRVADAAHVPLLSDYFRLTEKYARDLARLKRDPRLAPAVASYRGLRLLRQEPWETLVAFIASANNNVPRIEGLVEGLARAAGTPVRGAPDAFRFPEAERVARFGERRLRGLGFGYRAPYVAETAKHVARGDVDLEALRRVPYAGAHRALLELPGVGPKVADCVCLFSLDKTEAFPVDRWVHRILRAVYADEAPSRPGDVGAWARARWGRAAGLAQQFLFHAARMEGTGSRAAPGARAAV